MSGTLGIISPIQQYVSYSTNEAKHAASYALSNPQETILGNYFTKNAASITTPAQLLGNYKALSVVLGAFGIGDLIGSTALVKQLLTQDPSNTGSTAHRIGNAKYLAFAKALHSWSPPPFATPSAVAATVKAYQLFGFEASQNAPASGGGTAQNNGLQQALYFTRIAPSITSYLQLQSDQQLLNVAVTAVGLPLTAFDGLSFEQQSALLKQKLPIANLTKPGFVTHLAEQYIVQQQLANGPVNSTPQAGSLLNAFSDSDTTAGSLLTILNASDTATTSLSSSGTTAANPLLSLFV